MKKFFNTKEITLWNIIKAGFCVFIMAGFDLVCIFTALIWLGAMIGKELSLKATFLLWTIVENAALLSIGAACVPVRDKTKEITKKIKKAANGAINHHWNFTKIGIIIVLIVFFDIYIVTDLKIRFLPEEVWSSSRSVYISPILSVAVTIFTIFWRRYVVFSKNLF